MRYLCILILISILTSSCTFISKSTPVIDHSYTDQIVQHSDMLKRSHQYNVLQVTFLPVQFAYKSGNVAMQTKLRLKIMDILQQRIALSSLSQVFPLKKIDQKLMNWEISGSENRQIIPIVNEDRVTEVRLITLHLGYWISQVLKNEIVYNGVNKTNLEFVKQALSYLMADIVKPFWTEMQAWHWAKPDFDNQRLRTFAKLGAVDAKRLNKRSFYRAMIDEDGFLSAISADVLFVMTRVAPDLVSIYGTQSDRAVLLDIRNTYFQYLVQKSSSSDEFHFSIGDWDDHPDYAAYGCKGAELPDKKCLSHGVSPDTSHFKRFPIWIRSYRDSWDVGSEQYLFYEQWLKSFAKHFVNNVIDKELDDFWFLNNYIDGTNGWYRVGYHKRLKFGYAPSQLTLASVFGEYYTLNEYDARISEWRTKNCQQIADSYDKFKMYYEEPHSTSFSRFMDDIGLADEKQQLYLYYCRLMEQIEK